MSLHCPSLPSVRPSDRPSDRPKPRNFSQRTKPSERNSETTDRPTVRTKFLSVFGFEKYRPSDRPPTNQGLDLQVVDSVGEADFILAHGTETLGQSSGAVRPVELQDLMAILEACAVKNIPMVVANPDYVTVEAPSLRIMPACKAQG
ncbi:unnamed protein product [Rhodiola kirilowii]